MIVVNKDFRDWFLAYHLEQHLQKGTHTLLCLIGGEGNAYLREVLLRYPVVNTIRDLSATAFGQAALVILETLPIRQQEAALRSASASGAAVWDIISLYTVYETVRLPTDYLLDEFHTTMEADWLNYTVCRDRISCDYISRYIAKRYQDGQQTLFNKLEIETVNRCNGKCAFCPVNRTADPRPYQRMEESLFLQILGQLEQLSYTGALGIFSNNEPLLDVRFPAFARSARKALPDAFLYIYTNGSLLTEANLPVLLQTLDWIHVDCYTDQPALPPKMEHLRALCQKWNVPPEKISFHLRNPKELLTTRAGTAPNRGSAVAVHSLCPLPFSQMVVRPDGKVSQCCNDALGRATLGDLSCQTLEEVWFGESLESLRKSMLSNGRAGNALCCRCDTIFTCLPYEERSLRDEPVSFFPHHSDLSDR